MAFKEIQNFLGTQNDQKQGQHMSMYGKYISVSGQNAGDVIFYKKSIDGTWSVFKEWLTPPAFLFGTSVLLYKGDFWGVFDLGADRFLILLSSSNSFSFSVTGYVKSDADPIGFGEKLSASDNYLAVSASGYNNNKGAVYLYEKAGENWDDISEYSSAHYTRISPALLSANDYFGSSVSINDNFLIIGAKGDSDYKGAIYVYEKDIDTGIWEESYKLFASDGIAGDRFGSAMSLSGDYLAVGAEYADLSDTEINAGAVYLFKYSESSDRWYEIKKLTGIDETDLSGNRFGHSLDLKGDYLVVGSPYARLTGVADVFYKKRDWSHLKKLIGSDSNSDDQFGESVGIYYPYLAVGASEYTEGNNKGKMYIFQDPPIRLRVAQEFDVDKAFVPSKASVYLKRSGKNTLNYFPLYSDRENIIDATNFSTITQGTNKVIFDDRIATYTGNGYMILAPEENLDIMGDSFSVINYPIRSIVDDTYQLWLRCYSNNFDNPSTTSFEVDILLDGEVVRTISDSISVDDWSWLQTNIVIPDRNEHILGIKLKGKGNIIDKIYIEADSTIVPEGDGPYNSDSPFVTVHMKVYDGEGKTYPSNPMFIYDYKTTVDEVVQDDWYNFNISEMDSRAGYTNPSSEAGNYFLVLSSSGSTPNNFIIWELTDTDEYMNLISALTVDPGSASQQMDLVPLDYYKAKIGDSGLSEDIWYINYNKRHAFKIYSDFDPIEDV